MSPNREKSLSKIARIMKQSRTGMSITISTQMVQTVAAVAMYPGKSLSELTQIIGSNTSTVSRNLLDLGKGKRGGGVGYGFVDRTEDQNDLRNNQYHITIKGQMFLDSLVDILED